MEGGFGSNEMSGAMVIHLLAIRSGSIWSQNDRGGAIKTYFARSRSVETTSRRELLSQNSIAAPRTGYVCATAIA